MCLYISNKGNKSYLSVCRGHRHKYYIGSQSCSPASKISHAATSILVMIGGDRARRTRPPGKTTSLFFNMIGLHVRDVIKSIQWGFETKGRLNSVIRLATLVLAYRSRRLTRCKSVDNLK